MRLLSGFLPGHQAHSPGWKGPPFPQEGRVPALRPPGAVCLLGGGPAKEPGRREPCVRHQLAYMGTVENSPKKKKSNILETVSALAKPLSLISTFRKMG